jgi:surface polysaccharide O-acyltransferase-like enzyme
MHAAVTYSGFGDWYYVEGNKETLSVVEMVFFGFFQSFLQAWFMGILFFISAYLAAKALAKRGSINFIKERLFRLGIPLLIYVFLIQPFNMYLLLNEYPVNSFGENYFRYIVDFYWHSGTGPLWFVEVLLIFCIVYAIGKKFKLKSITLKEVRTAHIISVITIIAVIAFLIRIVMPIGTSFLNLQVCYFPSYIVMFIAGIIIGENDLLENLTCEKNIRWFKLAFIIGLPLWAATMLAGGALDSKEYYNGGLCWQNAAFALWESFTAIAFSIGLIVLFKKKVNIDNAFTRLMRNNAFGIYCFHAPILIVVSLVMKNLVLFSIVKFILVLMIASLLCLLFSFLIRKIKPIAIVYK